MYQPDQKILEKYADLLVNFALNSGQGVKEGEVVMCIVDDVAKPLLVELHKAILKAGAHPMLRMIPTGMNKTFYELANDAQLTYFPEEFLKARVAEVDHQIGILSEVDPHELEGIDPQKMFKAMDSQRKVREWLTDKENKGKFTWTLALYGTQGMATEAGLSLEDYWNEIITGCYLDKEDPKFEWKRIADEQKRVMGILNSMKIDYLEIKGENVDLKVELGPNRKWLGGSGRNIPSYELFISPHFKGTQGKIKFNQPLFRYGNILRDVELEFKDGHVVKAKAATGQDVLDNMLKRENASRIGEFSLTDARLSRIHKFMANTLFDENIGGEFGNMHIALGSAYKDSYTGDPSAPTKEEWLEMGYNDSPEHTDIINTEDKTVTAVMEDGSEVVIYKSGQFIV